MFLSLSVHLFVFGVVVRMSNMEHTCVQRVAGLFVFPFCLLNVLFFTSLQATHSVFLFIFLFSFFSLTVPPSRILCQLLFSYLLSVIRFPLYSRLFHSFLFSAVSFLLVSSLLPSCRLFLSPSLLSFPLPSFPFLSLTVVLQRSIVLCIWWSLNHLTALTCSGWRGRVWSRRFFMLAVNGILYRYKIITFTFLFFYSSSCLMTCRWYQL